MTNALTELQKTLTKLNFTFKDVEWASLGYAPMTSFDAYALASYPEMSEDEFLSKLDFDYDNGYGSQHLFGVVVFKDGTWLSRGEYDGSEWWKYNLLPKKENYKYDCESD